MAGLTDILSALQSGVALLAQIQDTLTHQVPQLTSGHVEDSLLIQSGYVRVLGVSVVGGTGGSAMLHDCAAVADASPLNAVYAVSNTAGYYPTNMVFEKGLVLIESPGSTKCAIFYART